MWYYAIDERKSHEVCYVSDIVMRMICKQKLHAEIV